MKIVVTEKRMYVIPPELEESVRRAIANTDMQDIDDILSDIGNMACEEIDTVGAEELQPDMADKEA